MSRDDGVKIGAAKTAKKKAVSRSAVPDMGSKRRGVEQSAGREDRDMADHDREDDDGSAVTREQRESFLRDEALQSKLPNPPKRPGVHYLWASTTNTYNPISWYIQLGYRPVKASALGKWADATRRGTTGEYEGMVCVNEMVLMQCSEETYQHIMRVMHHDKPNEEGTRLRGRIDAITEGDVDSMTGFEDTNGKKLVHEEGDGLKDVGRARRAPTFQ